MPAYEEALAADPGAFVAFANEMGAAGDDLTEHRAAYDTTVAQINDGWQDQANRAFNDDVDLVDEHVDQVASKVGDAAEVLSTGGSAMVSQVEQLRATDAAYRGAGFVVQPAPRVELGPVHWAAIAAAGPFGPVLQAMFQARADEGTTRLATGLAVLTATDVATGAALTAAAEALEPLEDKGPGATDCLPVADDEHDANLEHQERRTTTEADGDPGKDDKDTEKRQEDKEEDQDEDAEDKDEQNEDKDDQDQQPPQAQRPEDPQDDTEQTQDRPSADEIPESPDPARPEVPDLPTGPDTPTAPNLGDPWKPTEPDDTETPAGGLASGGGLGGGLASPETTGTGTGAGGTGGLVTTPAGSAAPATAAGGRSGLGGGMVGAPGARGAVNPDDEFERESFLIEDPEEDVWGIGTDEGNPYVDYLEEQPQQPDQPPSPQIEDPPFTIPGFDLPEPGKP